MKVEEEFTSFTGQVNVGNIAKFIKISDKGYDIVVDELIKRTQHFFRIVLFGNPFFDKIDVPKLIKGTMKVSPDVVFDIFAKSNIRPISLGKFENVNYFVNIPLKNMGGTFDERINITAVKWFMDAKANFIFDVRNEDDVDEVISLINIFGVSKRLVYLSPNSPEKIEEIMAHCVRNKFNLAPNFRKFLWDDFGKGGED